MCDDTRPPPDVHPTLREKWTAARRLLRFGGPFTASQLVGSGVAVGPTLLVLHLLSKNDVGFYRAARPFPELPRLLNRGDGPGLLSPCLSAACSIRDLGRLSTAVPARAVVGGADFLVMLALVPYLVPLLYTSQFMPAVALLECS